MAAIRRGRARVSLLPPTRWCVPRRRRRRSNPLVRARTKKPLNMNELSCARIWFSIGAVVTAIVGMAVSWIGGVIISDYLCGLIRSSEPISAVDLLQGLPIVDLFVQIAYKPLSFDKWLFFISFTIMFVGAYYAEKRTAIRENNSRERQRQQLVGALPPDVEKYNEPLAKTKETECVVCQHREKSVAFVPCGHRCCCRTCSEANDKCPVCRSIPTGRFRIFD